MLGGKISEDAEEDSHEAVVRPAAPGAVGRALADRIPREEIESVRGEPNASDEATGGRSPYRLGFTPPDRLRHERRPCGVGGTPGTRLAGRRTVSSTRAAEGERGGSKHESHSHSTAARGVRVPLVAFFQPRAFGRNRVSRVVRRRRASPVTGFPHRGRRRCKHRAAIVGTRTPAPARPLIPRAPNRGGPFPRSRQPVFVVGCIHGTECAGVAGARPRTAPRARARVRDEDARRTRTVVRARVPAACTTRTATPGWSIREKCGKGSQAS